MPALTAASNVVIGTGSIRGEEEFPTVWVGSDLLLRAALTVLTVVAGPRLHIRQFLTLPGEWRHFRQYSQSHQHRRRRGLFSCPPGWVLIPGPITARGTDDADGTDRVFSARTHPDDSLPGSFTRERDLNAQRP
jgi:hypothetical protein